PGNTPDTVCVPLEGERFLAGGGVPHLQVPAGTGETLAVGAPTHAPDNAPGVSLEGGNLLTGGHVPDVHRQADAAGEACTIRTPGDALDGRGVPLGGEGFLPGRGIPHLQFPPGPQRQYIEARAGAGKAAAVRAPANAIESRGVPLNCERLGVRP